MKNLVACFSATIIAAVLAYSKDEKKAAFGCVKVDVNAPGINLPSDQSWQNWCDLSDDQTDIKCFDWIDGEWVERVIYEKEYVLKRQKAGERTCPSLPDGTKPIIRN